MTATTRKAGTVAAAATAAATSRARDFVEADRTSGIARMVLAQLLMLLLVALLMQEGRRRGEATAQVHRLVLLGQ